MNREYHKAAPANVWETLKTAVAEKLEHAAGSLDAPGASAYPAGPYSRQASEWLHHSAAYVRALDLQKADLELRGRIQTHPGRSVLIGLAAGLLAGFWLQRRS